MNWYFYQIFLPLHILALFAVVSSIFGYIDINWIMVLISWLLIGPIGIGVGYHRLFSHRQFKTYRIVEYALALLGTMAAYAPLLFWASQHQYHHRVSDTEDDPSSPIHGFWESYLFWRLRKNVLAKIHLRNYPTRQILKDKFLMLVSKKFVYIVYTFAILLAVLDLNLLISIFVIPALIEHQRINIVSSLSHCSLPFNYKNFPSSDNAGNNAILGYLTFGFGWHNNHHAYPRKLINMERWWEVDIEGIIAWCISKK